MDLTEFLRGRLDEDERAIRADAGLGLAYGWPARLLAEVEAKRAVLDAYHLRREQGALPGGEVIGYHATGILVAIRALAQPYRDHPDYRLSWDG